jgi:hydroxypyruvate reductase
MQDPRTFLRSLFDAAVAAADPRVVLPHALPPKPRGRCVVVGAGKSAALMAQVLDQAWPDVALSGAVVTRYGHAVPAGRIDVLEASHPLPDENSQAAASRMLAAVAGLTADDLVIALISGGGSALMALPAPGLTLSQKRGITQRLLHSGAGIADMNTVRRRLSAIKGGSLAAAAGPAPVVTLAISDIPGDDPASIASGPTWPPATAEDDSHAEAILHRYGIPLPDGMAPYHPKPRRPQDSIHLIATPALSLRAAARIARAAGVTPVILGDALEGESRELGRALAGIAISCQRHGQPAQAPAVLLSGGETTVTIGDTAPGQGGRNTEFLLAFALQLAATPAPADAPTTAITALAGDTDGIDGTQDAAGAIVTPDTLARARAAGLDPRAVLAGHDSYSLFARLNDLIITGPTLTNVNDFRAVLIA